MTFRKKFLNGCKAALQMGNLSSLISQRLKKGEGASSKMAAMAEQSANGQLSSFGGLFGTAKLSPQEENVIEGILETYATPKADVQKDLSELLAITTEVKAINNQAALLHGERVKSAHTILTHYREGAFTAWLLATYGNRQTPYNLMLYYEFYEALPKPLRPRLEMMPRQAIYTLASREGSIDEKLKIVKNYNGETKTVLLQLIREAFPLEDDDRRRQNIGDSVIEILRRACAALERPRSKLTKTQRQMVVELIELLQERIT